ncbi:unnamed protein product, partial [Polarella glacialis]
VSPQLAFSDTRVVVRLGSVEQQTPFASRSSELLTWRWSEVDSTAFTSLSFQVYNDSPDEFEIEVEAVVVDGAGERARSLGWVEVALDEVDTSGTWHQRLEPLWGGQGSKLAFSVCLDLSCTEIQVEEAGQQAEEQVDEAADSRRASLNEADEVVEVVAGAGGL